MDHLGYPFPELPASTGDSSFPRSPRMPQRSYKLKVELLGPLTIHRQLVPEREDKQSSNQSIWFVPHTLDLQNTAIILLCFLAMKISDGRGKKKNRLRDRACVVGEHLHCAHKKEPITVTVCLCSREGCCTVRNMEGAPRSGRSEFYYLRRAEGLPEGKWAPPYLLQ